MRLLRSILCGVKGKGGRILTVCAHNRGWLVGLVCAALFVGGCSVSKKTAVAPAQKAAPARTAAKAELIARYNNQASAIQSLNASVTLKLTAGSAYSGVIEQYHEVNAFILAQRPASIRMIGQAPVVGKNIFDMVSDGSTFSVYIPSKNKFLTGPSNFERHADKPIENLRPQHLIDALLWAPIADGAPVLIEEAANDTQRSYVLTVIRTPTAGGGAAVAGASDWEIASKIYFDRADLHVARIETFGAAGALVSDAMYSGSVAAGDSTYPSTILISRPGEDYKLDIAVKKLTVNEKVEPDRFVLKQPEGAELVRVGDETKNPQ
jgi:outer membrane lipoprotein-sorting protein